eukprot:jgi/Botrbrau1/11953/Bobra.341_1s0018.1
MTIHCRKLDGVAKCEAVVVVEEPCLRVVGMLMKHYQKGDLHELISNEPSTTCCRKFDLALEVACNLERLHRFGVIHGDLKASNILVADDGSLHFCDFETAIVRDDPSNTADGWNALVVGFVLSFSTCFISSQACLLVSCWFRGQLSAGWSRGTDPYTPPELFLPGAIATPQSDIFAFGALLCLLIEQQPHVNCWDMEEHEKQYLAGNIFYGESFGDDWPTEWRTLVLSCMAFAPSDRPCLGDIIKKLEELQQQHSPAT